MVGNSGCRFGSVKAKAAGQILWARMKRRWRGLAAAAWVLTVVAYSAVMH
jgi:hypothetical protein